MTFRKVAAEIAAAFCLLLAPAAGQAEKLAFGHILEEGTAHHRNMVWAAGEFRREFGDRHTLEVFPRGLLGRSDTEVIEGFRNGNASMAYLSFGHVAEFYAPLAVGGCPFLFRDFVHWERFRDSALFEELVEGFHRESGMVVLGLAYYGQRHITTKTPLRGVDDLRGLLIRVPNMPTMIQAFRLLGARPVPIPFRDVYQALQDEIVQAQENPLPTILTMKFHEVTPVINLTGHIADGQLVVMDGKAWARFGESERVILRRIFVDAAARVTEEVRRQELDLLAVFRGAGVTINPMPVEDLAAKMLPHLVSQAFPWGEDVVRRIRALP